MLLRSIHQRPIDAYKQALLIVTSCAFNNIVNEAGQGVGAGSGPSGGPRWPREWSDSVLSPPKDIEAKARSENALKWMISKGVPVQRWLNAMKAGIRIAAPEAKGGGVGRAYMIGDKVVKFTPDEHEAKAASTLLHYDLPNVAKIYGVARLQPTSTQPRTLYAIVTALVPNKIPKKYRVAANGVWTFLDRANKPIDDVDTAKEKIMTEIVPAKYKGDPDVRLAVEKILKATDEIYRKTGILLQDPHAGNVLLRGKEVQFFDFGRFNYSTLDADIQPIS